MEKSLTSTADRPNNFAQNPQLAARVTIASVKYGDCYPGELTRFPRPYENPGGKAVISTLDCQRALT